MKIIPIENEQKYPVGEVVILPDGVLYKIDSVIIEFRNKQKLKEIGKQIVEKRKSWARKGCCGAKKPITELKLDVYKYTYLINGQNVNESDIRGCGIDYVNDLINTLKAELDDANEKIQDAAEKLGYTFDDN